MPAPTTTKPSQELAVVLHDLAWLLPRTVGRSTTTAESLLPSELEVMRLLVRRPGLRVSEVASELRMQGSNASTAVGALVRAGLIERRSDSADGRAARLVPTAKAVRNRARREAGWGAEFDALLGELSDADAAAVVAAIPGLRALATRLAT